MKKIIVTFVVILAVFSCKKKEDAPAPETMMKAASCITLEDYDKLTTNEERAAWLRDSGSLVCDTILYPREIIHAVPNGDVAIPSGSKGFIVSWDNFKTLIGTTIYEEYVGFELDSVNNVSKVIMVPKYLETDATYSVPLFRSIDELYKFNDKTELEFIRVLIKDESRIAIRFKNEEGGFVYYDLYNNPI
jgi:hypothetical protein